MKIGIIDSGIDLKHKMLKDCQIKGKGIIFEDEKCIITDDFHDKIGHGTAIAGIVHKSLPDINLFIVKVFDEQLVTHEKVICKSLELCIENKVDLINMSLGIETQNPSNALVGWLKKAYELGIVIIAAANNTPNIECYPAFFPTVFGVISGKIKNRFEYGHLNNSSIEFVAKGSIQRVIWKEGGYNITGGTSYACPHFSVIVGKMMQTKEFCGIQELRKDLIEGANKNIYPIHSVGNIEFSEMGIHNVDTDKIGKKLFFKLPMESKKNILLFPSSEKEINTLLEFPDLVIYNISLLIDYPKMGNLKHNKKFKIEHRLPTSEELENIDTLVLGYFHDHQFEANVKFGFDLVKLGLRYNKNFFVFDSRLKDVIQMIAKEFEYKGKIFLPNVTPSLYEDVKKLRFLPKLKTPVMAVIGTSNKQGKITTQLRLKQILENEGYKVALISSEPQGELLGACFSFPFGFQSTVQINREEWSGFLRILLRAVQEYIKPDIILTGIQGGFVPRVSKTKLWGSEMDALEYIHGILPDAFVCAINPEDDVNLINSVVSTAFAFTKSNTLFFQLNPAERNYDLQQNNSLKLLTKEEYRKKRQFFQTELSKEVLDIMDPTHDKQILNVVEEFFS